VYITIVAVKMQQCKFPHYLINGMFYQKKKIIEDKMCVLIFFTTLVSNISHSRKKSCITINVHRSTCKVPVILVKI